MLHILIQTTSTGCMQTGKSGKIISKSPVVWRVRESKENDVPGQGKSEKNILVQISQWRARNYNNLEI